ncbi:hypothetical protein ACFV2H_35030 [Streptomyces sp. NPDC059629]|uniref:hypothetical protein n=1 Tax=Streptomyces sp. NPDC059629 TaxID=3346889 RepID=UPI0036931C9B
MDRVTEFEHGMPQAHQAWDGNGWRHDPAVIDDQALVINQLIVPGHCTGWSAQHTLAAALPDAWVQTSIGTTYTLSVPRAGHG